MGGWDAFRTTCYDDAYILSLPGFHWFKAPDMSGGPRAFHTCNVVGNRQMVVVGGVNYYNLGVPGDWKDPDPWSQGIGVFDMTQLSWSAGYDAGAAAYESPDKVKAWYDQGNGNQVAWTDDKVKALFTSKSGNGGSSGTGSGGKSSKSSPNHTGAIVGGVVGGVAGLALIAGAAWFLMRRKKSNAAAAGTGAEKANANGRGEYAYQQAPPYEGPAEVAGEGMQPSPKRMSELPAGGGHEVHELAGTEGARK
ncbi:kelch repeat protein [Diplodia corticola]|uniref:Kelch repeat protein n=1 Tax=Diplodia corticola TaxID=236234 RepID=A0A1J9RP74_9PEZI|nr:kelch repeat protein [Diplodia corticola]OJD30271.1 kelch repeat protein [Diplodia corticola]